MFHKLNTTARCLALLITLLVLFQPAALGAMANVEVTVGDAPVLRPGDVDQEITSIFMTEKIPGALAAGNSIILQLPEEATWNQIPDIRVLAGDIVLEAGQFVADSGQKSISFNVITASTVASDIEFTGGTLDLDAGAEPGALISTIVAISGEGEVAINTAVAVEDADVPQVLAGLQNQPAGSITITESAPGSIMAHPNGLEGHLYVILPEGVSFTSVPDVAVEGNLEVDTGNVSLASINGGSNNTLDIPVLGESIGEAASIVISNIRLTLDRMVPIGTITAVIRGSAVDQISSETAGNDPALYTRNVATFNIAECVDEIVAAPVPALHTAVFTLGQSSYISAGRTISMDAAPYAANNRVLIPYRYLAASLGIPDDEEHISWDQATQTATLKTPAGDLITIVLGSSIMTINGQEIQMDVAAQQTDGHIYLPARWLAEALGGSAEWVPKYQQVLIKITY